MAKARELIAAKNYNDAILILTEVVREEPERQDEAQELISEIVKIRNQYNSDYASLIDTLNTQDVDGALKEIAQLEDLDKNPNKQTKDQIGQAKRLARLKANQKRYRDIMARGLALLDQKQYSGAIQVYLEGSTRARDMFDEADYGHIVANPGEQAWVDLKAGAALYAQAEAKLKTLVPQGTPILAGGAGTLDSLLVSMRDPGILASPFIGRRQDVPVPKPVSGAERSARRLFSRLFLSVRARAHRGKDAWRAFLGAFDRQWADIMTPWTDQIKKTVDARYAAAKALVDQGKAGRTRGLPSKR